MSVPVIDRCSHSLCGTTIRCHNRSSALRCIDKRKRRRHDQWT